MQRETNLTNPETWLAHDIFLSQIKGPESVQADEHCDISYASSKQIKRRKTLFTFEKFQHALGHSSSHPFSCRIRSKPNI